MTDEPGTPKRESLNELRKRLRGLDTQIEKEEGGIEEAESQARRHWAEYLADRGQTRHELVTELGELVKRQAQLQTQVNRRDRIREQAYEAAGAEPPAWKPDKLDQELADVEGRIESLEDRIEAHEGEIRKELEKRVARLRGDQKKAEERLDDLQRQREEVQAQIEAREAEQEAREELRREAHAEAAEILDTFFSSDPFADGDRGEDEDDGPIIGSDEPEDEAGGEPADPEGADAPEDGADDNGVDELAEVRRRRDAADQPEGGDEASETEADRSQTFPDLAAAAQADREGEEWLEAVRPTRTEHHENLGIAAAIAATLAGAITAMVLGWGVQEMTGVLLQINFDTATSAAKAWFIAVVVLCIICSGVMARYMYYPFFRRMRSRRGHHDPQEGVTHA